MGVPEEPEPWELVRTLPTVVVPVTVGTFGDEGAMPLMDTVGVVEEADAVPVQFAWEFAAVTTTRTYFPTSALVSAYVLAVPALLEQPAPSDVQYCTW